MTCWAGYVAHNHSPFPLEGLGSGTTKLVNVITCYSMTLKAWMMKCGFLQHSPFSFFCCLLMAERWGKVCVARLWRIEGMTLPVESVCFQSLSVARPHMEVLATCYLTGVFFHFKSRQYCTFFSTTVILCLTVFIKINLFIIFPVTVSSDFLLLVFLYCPLPLLPSQSVLVRTLFCSWY